MMMFDVDTGDHNSFEVNDVQELPIGHAEPTTGGACNLLVCFELSLFRGRPHQQRMRL